MGVCPERSLVEGVGWAVVVVFTGAIIGDGRAALSIPRSKIPRRKPRVKNNKAPMAQLDELKGPEANALPDTATLPADLAALYLCISPAQLADLRKSKRPERGAGNGPSIIKPVEGGPAGPKDPVLYQLGTLREYAKAHTAPSAFDTALNPGMLAGSRPSCPSLPSASRASSAASACSSAAPGTARTRCAKAFHRPGEGPHPLHIAHMRRSRGEPVGRRGEPQRVRRKGPRPARSETQAIEASLARPRCWPRPRLRRRNRVTANPDAAA
jgi:hypothetical protein